jgi:2-hydroxychromene-2-carboxylate isomerase
MDDPAAAGAALDAAGLDGRAILDRTREQAVKDRLIANTEGAVARGVFGMPTFFVGKEMFFGKDRLGQVEEELAKA